MGPATKVEPTPSAELDKKREYIVREIFSTETTYVKNLSDCITVRVLLFLLFPLSSSLSSRHRLTAPDVLQAHVGGHEDAKGDPG